MVGRGGAWLVVVVVVVGSISSTLRTLYYPGSQPLLTKSLIETLYTPCKSLERDL